jgi:site-specific DNA recombinase
MEALHNTQDGSFSRSVRGLALLLEELDKAVDFRSATEPFDTTTPAGRMMVQMLGGPPLSTG